MKIITHDALGHLSQQAAQSPRRRRNLNLHDVLDAPVQRLCNAIEPGSYVRPHRHDGAIWELFSVLVGTVRLLSFDDDGAVTDAVTLGARGDAALVELPGGIWHSLVALDPGSIIFEIKPGPYRPLDDKDFAAWAPAEDAPEAASLQFWMQDAPPGALWRP